MISANGGLPAHRYTPQVTQRWPRGSEPASVSDVLHCPLSPTIAAGSINLRPTLLHPRKGEQGVPKYSIYNTRIVGGNILQQAHEEYTPFKK